MGEGHGGTNILSSRSTKKQIGRGESQTQNPQSYFHGPPIGLEKCSPPAPVVDLKAIQHSNYPIVNTLTAALHPMSISYLKMLSQATVNL